MKRTKRKKNPEQEQFVKQLLKNSEDYEFLGEGGFGEAWYFIIGENLQIGSQILKPGEYVIKLFNNELKDREVKYLNKLSKEKLIPYHYILTKYYIIMDFVEGKPFRIWIKNHNYEDRQKIFDKIKDKIEKWHIKGFAHEDLNPENDNILIDKNQNIHFLDPALEDIKHPNFEMDLVDLDLIKRVVNWGKLIY